MSARHTRIYTETHTTVCERELWRIKKRGEQRRIEEKKLQAAGDKEVSVVENMESDIKAMQFNLLALAPETHS